MYVQEQFAQTCPAALKALIAEHPLATFISTDTAAAAGASGALQVNHFPMILHEDPAGDVLQGHIPRANPLSGMLDKQTSAIAVFQGMNTYITPSWYPSKAAHGKVVPTWNYVVVHVRGTVRAVTEETWLRRHLDLLTDHMEAAQPAPWRVTDAPAEFTSVMLKAIVGIELTVESMIGKWKVSQNRTADDRRGVSSGLQARGDEMALAMRDYVESAEPTEG